MESDIKDATVKRERRYPKKLALHEEYYLSIALISGALTASAAPTSIRPNRRI